MLNRWLARLRYMMFAGKHRQHRKHSGPDYRPIRTQDFERMFNAASYRERMRFGR